MKDKAYILLVFCAVISIFFAGCEKTDSKTELTPEQRKRKLEGSISIITANYLAYLSDQKKKQDYDKNLILRAKEIKEHGFAVKELLMRKIGENPLEDLLLIEAYFRLVGETKETLGSAIHSKNKTLSHHATFRYELLSDSGYIWGEKYLNVLFSALVDKSIFACEQSKKGKPVWLFAATKIKALLALDLALDESSENAPNFDSRINLLKNNLQISIPFLYSRIFEQPSALYEYKTYHLDHEAMNANTPTKIYRAKKNHKWKYPIPNSGYGSPCYDEKCFEKWKISSGIYKFYDRERWELDQFESMPGKKKDN